MQQYIANGRSTPGPAQKNEAAISLDGKGKASGKQVLEEKLARDPTFD